MGSRKWKMPKWMRPYLRHLTYYDRVEELMNTDGATANVFNNAPLALICVQCKAQVGTLTSLYEAKLLKPVPTPDTPREER